MYLCNVDFGGSMKPSKWLLAAIRALAASIVGQTASAHVYTAKGENFCGLPHKIERCLRMRYGGGGVATNFGLANEDHFLRHWARRQTRTTVLRDLFNSSLNLSKHLLVVVLVASTLGISRHGNPIWYDTRRTISRPSLRNTLGHHGTRVSRC